LIDLPKEKVKSLEHLKKNYRLFLLSNTNAIHEPAFTKIIKNSFGENVLEKLFEGIYFSHHLNLRKPDPEIYNYVLRKNQLLPDETLFVDDSPQHIEGAKKVGLHAFYFEKGMTLGDLFKE
jgi:HAD superfamily hydrolase (TIGR01549 family)